jgi:glycosyltransferase involved in cell wall biosynthesis
MKILQVNNYHYLRGGSDRVYLETGTLLEKAGYPVVYFSVAEPGAREHGANRFFPTDREFWQDKTVDRALRAPSFIYSRAVRAKLDALIRSERPDVAHLHIFFGRLSLAVLYSLKRHRIPIVLTVHEYKMLCPVYTLLDSSGHVCELCASGNKFHAVRKKCNRLHLGYSTVSSIESTITELVGGYERFVDSFIFPSQFARDKHLEYKPKIVDRSHHLYNFTMQKVRQPKDGRTFRYAYIGRLAREKGIGTLMDAWNQAGLQRDRHLLIAGSGPLQSYVEAAAGCRSPGIEYVGRLQGTELGDLYSNIDFLIVCSEWYENNPLVVLEAFANGTPVIASNIGGLPELIGTDRGFLHTPGSVESLSDALRKADSLDNHAYSEFSARTTHFARKQLAPDKHVDKLISIYQRTIASY